MKRVVGSACVTVATAMTLTFPLGAVDEPGSRLELGTRVERPLSGAGSHTYSVALHGGESALLTVDQRGIDVSIRVLDPTGTAVADFDAEARKDGQERAQVVAEDEATYQVVVSARYPRESAGSYAVQINSISRATDLDRLLDKAHRLETTIEPLRSSGKYADAVTNL